MTTRTLDTDYLVIGAGAAGLAFTDSLLSESEDEVIIVDRRASPGGHWNDAYSFVRLHQPSLYYGVNSMPLGTGAIQTDGPEAGSYDRASGSEIREYFNAVMYRRLIPSGQVRFFPQCIYGGGGRFASSVTDDVFNVRVRKKVVDGTYLSPAIPKSTPPPFEIAEGVACIPVDQLPDHGAETQRFVIIGAGKTAMDACVWLLERGIDPERIQWVKPRESWLLNRRYWQGGELVWTLLEGIALQMEAAARAESEDDLFDRLEEAGQFRRVDRSVRPSMYKSATIADWELELLGRIKNVVRLGRIRRIERHRIVFDGGETPTTPDHVHVHCAADGLRRPPALPIFDGRRITLQPVRPGLVPFNAALVAFVEAHRQGDVEKNRLCPPNPYPDMALDWARATLIQMSADRALSREPDVVEWMERSRLNPMRGVRARMAEPRVQSASRRFAESVGPGLARLGRLLQQESARNSPMSPPLG
jgi:hypothetical protein